MHRIWLWVARFAVRRLKGETRRGGRLPDGIPGIRDPYARCEWYMPGRRELGEFPCGGDGHYLCGECRHYEVDPDHAEI